jgi:hypothetical protein
MQSKAFFKFNASLQAKKMRFFEKKNKIFKIIVKCLRYFVWFDINYYLF